MAGAMSIGIGRRNAPDQRGRLPKMEDGYVEPTTDYWQTLLAPDAVPTDAATFRYGYPARLPDGRILMLPIRRQPGDPAHAVASLIPNQASFEVVDALVGFMADLAAPLRPDVVVGMPTLGLALAPPVAQRLGHRHFAPLGYSRKYWYEAALSEPVRSITSPDDGKTVYLDPNLVPRLKDRRVVLVDDTISSGTTAVAVLRLLERAGAKVDGLVFAMSQGNAWETALPPAWAAKVRFVFRSPRLRLTPDGWVVDAP
jgi:adenine/guanine phosphoribosyltransferase-like PRPP-binding protein